MIKKYLFITIFFSSILQQSNKFIQNLQTLLAGTGFFTED